MTKFEQLNSWGFYIIKDRVEPNYITTTGAKLFYDVYVTKHFLKKQKNKSPLLIKAAYESEAKFRGFILFNIEN